MTGRILPMGRLLFFLLWTWGLIQVLAEDRGMARVAMAGRDPYPGNKIEGQPRPEAMSKPPLDLSAPEVTETFTCGLG